MGRFRSSVRQPENGRTCRADRVVALVACLAALLTLGQVTHGQSKDQAGSATLQGSVKDSRGRPIAAAIVYLEAKDGTQTLTARTDSVGSYRFSALRDGVYKLRAQMAGYGDASFDRCALEPKETRTVDLTLEPTPIPPPQDSPQTPLGTSSAEKPQFFDEPKFTVAGVTEAMNPGGHGSDTILRTTEALAKDTASLGSTAGTTESSGSSVVSSSSKSAAEQSLRADVEHEPGNFDVNRRLGKMLVDDGKVRQALPYLERASQLNPGDYENAYELALAHADAGQYERARTEARALLATPNRTAAQQAELHHLLGNIEEKLGNPLEAVREYQRAAELDPSEANLFDWGTDLLLHRAFEPAIEVFAEGNRLFPRSARMLAGLGVAWYARGAHAQAAQSLCEASDLNPDDPSPYLFLGKMQTVEAMQSDCVGERLGRFARLQPENAAANYYYALSLSKREDSQDANNVTLVESLLKKAVRLDRKLAAAYLQLGILHSQQGESSKAISAYQKAIQADPQLYEAHYRLAQAYSRDGEKSKAQAELQIYEQLSKKTAEEADRERREIRQFVYTLREQSPAGKP